MSFHTGPWLLQVYHSNGTGQEAYTSTEKVQGGGDQPEGYWDGGGEDEGGGCIPLRMWNHHGDTSERRNSTWRQTKRWYNAWNTCMNTERIGETVVSSWIHPIINRLEWWLALHMLSSMKLLWIQTNIITIMNEWMKSIRLAGPVLEVGLNE